MVTAVNTQQVEQQRDALVERILDATTHTLNTFTMYIGQQLGLYRTLAEHGRLTSAELAAFTGTQERYIREWLEQQTVAGILGVEDPTAPVDERRFYIPQGHVEVLVEQDSPNYLLPLAQIAVGAVSPIQDVLRVFRQGGGIPFGDYGRDMREGQAAINRVTFLQDLGQDWLPAIPDVHARLQANPPALIADIGVGGGWSSIGMAQAYPGVRVDGFDLDAPSIDLARANAAAEGVADRVQFQHRDAADPTLAGHYDLVTAFETVHDMADPVGALGTMRRLLKEGGAAIVVDERVGDDFANQSDVEAIMYGWSVLHCLPAGMADHPASAATGTVMRTSTLRQYAQAAGFKDVEVLPIDNFFFRVYRLIP